MNFGFLKKGTAFLVSFVVLFSGMLSSVVSAEIVEEVPVQQVQGSGGSNPLVVARLRAEGLERQKKLAEEEALRALEEKEKGVEQSDSRYAVQELPEYIPDFKTIGDVKAEQEAKLQAELALQAVVTEQTLTEKRENLSRLIESSDFSTQFSDIDDSDQKESIVILDALNIVSGRENTKFKPSESITRKEAIKISTLVSGDEIVVRTSSSVADIDDSDWSVPYVEALIEDEIIHLDGAGNLEGDLALTVDEAFALYLLTAGVCIEVDETVFPLYSGFAKNYSSDVIISDYKTDAVEGIEMSREDFAQLSVDIFNVLSLTVDYSPSVQLLGEQYSASQVVEEESLLREKLLEFISQ